jgi:hypothetical protein
LPSPDLAWPLSCHVSDLEPVVESVSVSHPRSVSRVIPVFDRLAYSMSLSQRRRPGPINRSSLFHHRSAWHGEL